MFGGIKIIESPYCVETVYAFPQSKHRSKRIHKKLLKRHGWYSKVSPTAYLIAKTLLSPETLMAHPDYVAKLKLHSETPPHPDTKGN